jgi:hypothetical protein
VSTPRFHDGMRLVSDSRAGRGRISSACPSLSSVNATVPVDIVSVDSDRPRGRPRRMSSRVQVRESWTSARTRVAVVGMQGASGRRLRVYGVSVVCSGTGTVLPHRSFVLVTRGEYGRGCRGETSPRPSVPPPCFPACDGFEDGPRGRQGYPHPGRRKQLFSGWRYWSVQPWLSALSQVKYGTATGCGGEARALVGSWCLTICLTPGPRSGSEATCSELLSESRPCRSSSSV